jgi:hypothetical protein
VDARPSDDEALAEQQVLGLVHVVGRRLERQLVRRGSASDARYEQPGSAGLHL